MQTFPRIARGLPAIGLPVSLCRVCLLLFSASLSHAYIGLYLIHISMRLALRV